MMSPYPDNVRVFVTQESVKIGESGYDVEVEVVRRSDLEVSDRKGKEVVSVGLREYCPLPDLESDDLFVVFDLGTVLEVDEVRLADPESGSLLPIKSKSKSKPAGPVRVPMTLRGAAQISLLLSRHSRPMGTLTVDLDEKGRLVDTNFLPEQEAF